MTDLSYIPPFSSDSLPILLLVLGRRWRLKQHLQKAMAFHSQMLATVIFTLLCLTGLCSCSLQKFQSSKSGESLNLLVVGDWGRDGLFNQSEVAFQMGRVGQQMDVDFVISTGDNFYKNGLKGTDDPQFETSFSQIYTAGSLQKPWYSVLGNHDYRGDVLSQLSPILKQKDPRWNCQRSFLLHYTLCSGTECGAGDFFFVDTTPFVNRYWEPSNHTYDWRGVLPRERYLANQLKDLSDALGASTATWKIVVGHHTIRSVGSHGDTEELNQQLLPIIQAHGVDLYINGHDHCLEHISSLDSPLQYITSGGGSKAWRGRNEEANPDGLKFFHDGQGFVSLQIQPTAIHMDFYDVYGEIVHELQLMKNALHISTQ